MKLQLLSDVHFEFWKDSQTLPYRLLKHVQENNISAVVIAGDLVDSWGLMNSIITMCKVLSPTPILYVAGNHEYYGGSPKDVTENLNFLQAGYSNFHWLDCSSVVLNNIKFSGATLWFPKDPLNVAYHHSWTDFYNIAKSRPWIYEQNERACDFFLNTQADVCISHHLPTYEVVAPNWKGEDSNRFFVTEILHKMQTPPKWWFFGHTHELTDQIAGDTRCIAHPRGYPREHTGGESYIGRMINIGVDNE